LNRKKRGTLVVLLGGRAQSRAMSIHVTSQAAAGLDANPHRQSSSLLNETSHCPHPTTTCHVEKINPNLIRVYVGRYLV